MGLLTPRSTKFDWTLMTLGVIGVALLSVPVWRVTGYLGRVAFDVISIALLLSLFSIRWHAAGGTCKLCRFAVYLVVPVMFIAEHVFLVYYLDPLSERQDATYAEYIKSVDPAIIPTLGFVASHCQPQPIAVVYSYKICLIMEPHSSEYLVTVVHPAAFFSEVDWDFNLRPEADGADIFAVSKSNEITSDLRRK